MNTITLLGITLKISRLIALLAFGIPLLLVPFAIPYLVLTAQKRHMTDKSDSRKLQSRPIPVLGGTAIVLAICSTLLIVSLFIDLSNLFPVMCVVVVLYIVGLIDDMLNLNYRFKFYVQICIIALLYFIGGYGIHNLKGLFGIYELSPALSFAVTLFMGLAVVNAINFADGIDGLAAALGCYVSLMCGIWCLRHHELTFSVISLIYTGSLLAFFPYNVFSQKYKIYMGDSGSLVLGLYVFLAMCVMLTQSVGHSSHIQSYNFSFILCLVALPLFDMVRVVVGRLLRRHSPFEPDRSHLHHLLVDLGLSHISTTLLLLILNSLVMLVWIATANIGLSITAQAVASLCGAFFLICFPARYIVRLRDRHPERYRRLSQHAQQARQHTLPLYERFCKIIDRH